MPGKVKNLAKLQEVNCAVLPSENGDRGSILMENGALSAIVRKAACQVEGVTRITGNSIVDNIAEFMGSKRIQDRSIQISVSGSELQIELSINVAYGFSLPLVASQVQQNVSGAIRDLTGLTVTQVNVVIREMEDLPEEDDEEEGQEEPAPRQ